MTTTNTHKIQPEEMMPMAPLNGERTANFVPDEVDSVREKWARRWSRLDFDGQGRVSLERVKFFMLMETEARFYEDKQVLELLKRVDRNEDGYIDYEEYMDLMLHTPKDTPTRRFLRRLAFMVIPRSARDLKTRMYLEEYSCMPPPLFVILISVAEIAFFIYYAVDMEKPVTSNGPCPVYSPLVYNPYRRREAWRYLSYMFIHSGYVHLINNLLIQLILGVPLEMVHKWWRVILVYFSGVLLGALLTSVIDPETYLVGASGGVYAVEYAFLGNLILNWKHFYYPWIHAIFLGVLTCADVGFAVWDTYFAHDPSNTGHMAHLGGAVAGLLVGVNVLRNLEREPWEKYCWWIAFIIFATLMLSTIILSIALPVGSFFPYPDDSPLQWHKRIF